MKVVYAEEIVMQTVARATIEELKQSALVEIPEVISLSWIKDMLAVLAIAPSSAMLSATPARISALKSLYDIIKEEGKIIEDTDTLDEKIVKIKKLLNTLQEEPNA